MMYLLAPEEQPVYRKINKRKFYLQAIQILEARLS